MPSFSLPDYDGCTVTLFGTKGLNTGKGAQMHISNHITQSCLTLTDKGTLSY